ncbi:MAG: YbjQ family protein [Hyphomicrobiales bacterium]
MIVVTTNDIPGFRVAGVVGLVRGISVRSRGWAGNQWGSIQKFFGGNLSVYGDLAERAREEALTLLVEHATGMGANAIVGMRYDANEIMDGVTEVLAYGTAVYVVKA